MTNPPIQKGEGGDWDHIDSGLGDSRGRLGDPVSPTFKGDSPDDGGDDSPHIDGPIQMERDGANGLESDGLAEESPVISLGLQGEDARDDLATLLGYEALSDWFEPVVLACDARVPGQGVVFRKCLMALLAGGHVLLEGVPGVGKTLIAETLGTVMGLSPSWIPLTHDGSVADMVGRVALDSVRQTITPHLGPVFSHVVIADGVNRMSPKMAGVLLGAMQSCRVMLDYQPYSLPDPFFVVGILTQDGHDAYPLPASLMDRWMMTVSVGYPSIESERAMVTSLTRGREIPPPVLASPLHVIEARRQCEAVHVEPSLIEDVVTMVAATRQPSLLGLSNLQPFIMRGASPRASVAIVQLAKVMARLNGRAYVVPDDVKRCIKEVVCPRLQLTFEAADAGMTASAILDRIMGARSIP